MIKENKKLKVLNQIIFLVILLWFIFPAISLAAMESDSFIMSKDVVGSFGSESSSDSYSLQDTGGESSVGDSDSDNFNLDAGFWSGDGEDSEITVNSPSDLNAEIDSNTEIKIEWNDNSDNEDGFEIERKKGSSGEFELIHTNSAGDTDYYDDNFDPETKYYYRVRAFSGEVYSGYSNEDDVTTGISEIDIDDLRGFCDYIELDASIDNDYYSDEELDFKVNIENLEDNNELEKEFNNKKTDSNGEVLLTIDSLERNTNYKLRISFKDEDDYSTWSDAKEIGTSGCSNPPEIIIDPDIPDPDDPEPEDYPEDHEEEDGTEEDPADKNDRTENIVGSVIGNVIDGAKKIKKVAEENKEVVTATSVATVPLLAFSLLSQLQSFSNLGALIRSILSLFTGIFSTKRKNWGTVFDSKSGKPIALATVSIFNEKDREVDSRVTDKFGAYSFLVSPGEYYLEVNKKGYEFDKSSGGESVLYPDQYDGEKIKVEEYDIVKRDIPMKKQEEAYQKELKKIKIKKTFSYTFLVIGIILSFGAFALDQTILNFSVCLIYVLSVFLSYRIMLTSVKWGTVVNENGKIEAFAILKVVDRNTGERKIRTVSDEKGRYFIILDPGDYKMEVSGVSGLKGELEFSLKKRSAFKKKIKLSGK